MKKPILLLTDLSDVAAKAYPYAVELARGTDRPLRLLYVMNPTHHAPPYDSPNPKVWRVRVQELFRHTLERTAAGLGDDIEVTPELVLANHTAEAAVEACAGADLVVMGSHGLSGFRRWFLGSMAGHVARFSPVPVLVVSAKGEAKPIDKVLMGVDLGDHCPGAIEQLCEVLGPMRAEVELFHAVVFPSLVPALREEAWTAPGARTAAEHKLAVDAAMLDLIPPDGTGALVFTKLHAQAERSAPAICARAKETGAALIAVASRGRSRFVTAWLGSVTDEILRRAESPVLVLKPNVA